MQDYKSNTVIQSSKTYLKARDESNRLSREQVYQENKELEITPNTAYSSRADLAIADN